MNYLLFLHGNARWLGAGALLAFGSSFGQTYFIAFFGAEIRAEYGLSQGEFGGLYTVATMASALALGFAGPLADSWPLQRLVWLVSGGLALACLAMACGSHPAFLLMILFMLRFFGQGSMSHISLTATGRWFSRQRGRAMGVVTLGYPLGEALLPLIAISLAAALGWRGTWTAAAGFLILILLPSMLLLLRRSRRPAGMAPLSSAAGAGDWSRRDMLRSPLFYTLMPGLLALGFITTGILFLQSHLVSVKSWERADFAATYIAYSSASIFAGILTGFLIDRFGAICLLPLYLLPMAAGCLIFARLDALWAAWAAMALLGMSAGMSITILGAFWAELYGIMHLGAVRAVGTALMVFSTAMAPATMGGALDLGISLNRQLDIAAAYSIGAALVFLLLQPKLLRQSRALAGALRG